MTPERFKEQVRQRVAEGHPPGAFAKLAGQWLGDEAPAFLASLPQTAAPRPAPQRQPSTPADGAQPRPPFYGDALKALLAAFGVTSWQGCGCEDKIRRMNTWTAEDVRANRETVAGWLKAVSVKAAVTGHWSALFAGGKMAKEEWFDPRQPFLSIVNQSIRLAESNP